MKESFCNIKTYERTILKKLIFELIQDLKFTY